MQLGGKATGRQSMRVVMPRTSNMFFFFGVCGGEASMRSSAFFFLFATETRSGGCIVLKDANRSYSML